MKLAIFGATGRTGQPLVEQALAAGHSVTALVRDPAKLALHHPQLTVIQGDVANAANVAQVVDGADAVLNVVGHGKSSPKDLMTTTARNIIAAMKEHRVKRLVALTGAGIGDPNDQPKLADKIITLLLKTLNGAVLQDSINHADLIKQSDLAWVIVRGPMLTEGPRKSQYRAGYIGQNSGTRISRADVADFMLRQLIDDTWLHKAPVISD